MYSIHTKMRALSDSAAPWYMLLVVGVLYLGVPGVAGQPPRCQEITIPMCRGIGYNYTFMPNQFNHETQEEAGLEAHQFYPLVEIKCSPDLRFFLCSMYAPICMTQYVKPLPACRSVCLRAKSGCAPLMAKYGFVWPEQMDCNEFPEYGSSALCMDPSISGQNSETPGENGDDVTTKSPTGTDAGNHGQNNDGNLWNTGEDGLNVDGINKIKDDILKTYSDKCSCKCRLQPVSESNSHYNKITTGGIQNCAMNCTSPYFDEEEGKFTTFWIGLWSILCCISTAITILTFLIDMQRFKYPERPIIFLSGCYLMISIGYIIRLVAGHQKVACDGDMIRYETTGPANCTVVFLLTYFFGMASSIWWVILAFTWFLSAGLKWGQEAIASYSQYFHLAAWLVPSIKSITVLAMSSVDGDPVAGICYVGNQNMTNLRGFVLIPLIVYLVLGTSFLLAGFVSLFRIRNVIKQQNGGKTDKLERLMIRIGVFSVLYTVPATVVISCYFYEHYFKEEWERSLNCPCEDQSPQPDYAVFMLKYFMCLVVGITSGFWVWTGKTVDTWKKLCKGKLCCRNNGYSYSRPPIKYSTPTSCSTMSTLHKPLPLSHV